jgi:hypothetical protein
MLLGDVTLAESDISGDFFPRFFARCDSSRIGNKKGDAVGQLADSTSTCYTLLSVPAEAATNFFQFLLFFFF